MTEDLISRLRDGTLESGVYPVGHLVDLNELTSSTASADVVRVALGRAESKSDFLRAISDAMKLPAAASNWDALEDWLRDLSWRPSDRHIVVLEDVETFAEAAPADYRTAVEVLSAVTAEWDRRGKRMIVILRNGSSAQERQEPSVSQ